MNNIFTKKEDLACRLMFQKTSLNDLNITQLYFYLHQFIQSSSKLSVADNFLYCYFDDINNFHNTRVGVHVIGWDANISTNELEICDFEQIHYRRYAIVLNSNDNLVEKIKNKIIEFKQNTDKQARISFEFIVKQQIFEVKIFLDFLSFVK